PGLPPHLARSPGDQLAGVLRGAADPALHRAGCHLTPAAGRAACPGGRPPAPGPAGARGGNHHGQPGAAGPGPPRRWGGGPPAGRAPPAGTSPAPPPPAPPPRCRRPTPP